MLERTGASGVREGQEEPPCPWEAGEDQLVTQTLLLVFTSGLCSHLNPISRILGG